MLGRRVEVMFSLRLAVGVKDRVRVRGTYISVIDTGTHHGYGYPRFIQHDSARLPPLRE